MSAKRLIALVLVTIMAMGTVTAFAQGGRVTLLSTQFNTVEEQEKIRDILGNFDSEVEFIGQEETPLLNQLQAEAEAGEGAIDLVMALHGTYPTMANEDYLFDLTLLLEEIEADFNVADAFVELGKMGTEDYQYYIPNMQATYIMAANVDALEYLPEGADINALSWEELAMWGQNIMDATGEAKLGIPLDGLPHRMMQGYLYPSFTGTMVTGYKSEAAVAMFEFLRNDFWPYVNPQSITYAFMQEPLLAGEVWVAWDHTARLLDAFTQEPDQFVAFPAPAGPAGRGFMPVIIGVGIPFTSPNPDGAEDLIRYLLSPENQEQVLNQLGFFPVVEGVDTTNLPEGVAIEAGAVEAQANSEDALPALLPVGLGERGNEFNQIYRDTFRRIVLDGEDIMTVLDEEAANIQAILDETGAPCWPPDVVTDSVCTVE